MREHVTWYRKDVLIQGSSYGLRGKSVRAVALTTSVSRAAPRTFCRDTQRHHHRRHARSTPSTPCTAISLCAIASGCCARRCAAPQCLRWPLPRPYTSIARQQMHIDPGPATRKDTTESAKAAVAAACQQTRAKGRLPEGRHNKAQEAQLWREEDC